MVCPHAGGVGLCEHVIHLRWVLWLDMTKYEMGFDSLIDYIAISGGMERNVIEYADHLHEHFVYPCRVSRGGRYVVPGDEKEGYR